ncbi:unnamed protein product [Somion occarium]|uniref:F-box domain-containing protein n=1 Tax=Somion occarium TaxID=3059160 RepID=A0ABP1E846_9APHY
MEIIIHEAGPISLKTELDFMDEDVLRLRESLDREVYAYREKCRRRNELLPVAKLLPELLLVIFEYYVESPRTYINDGRWKNCFVSPFEIHEEPKGPCDWIHVAHVCHSWRAIAMGAPQLWSHIQLGSPTWVSEFIKRSGQYPLTVTTGRQPQGFIPTPYHTYLPPRKFSFLPSQILSSLALVFSQFNRLQELNLNLPGQHLEHALEKFLVGGLAFPVLKHLSISDPTQPRTFHSRMLPPAVTNAHYPLLRRVDFRTFTLQWVMPCLRTELTSLILVNDHHQSMVPTLDDALRTLAQLPRLKKLVLNRMLELAAPDHASESIVHPANNIHLPNLQQFIILDCDPDTFDAFMRQLVFPPSASIIFNNMMENSALYEGTKKVISCVLEKSLPMDTPPLTGLTVEFSVTSHRYRVLTIEGYKEDSTLYESLVGNKPSNPAFIMRFEIQDFIYGITTFPEIHVARDTLLNAPLDGVQDLHVGSRLASLAESRHSYRDLESQQLVTSLLLRCSSSHPIRLLCLAGSIFNMLPDLLTSYMSESSRSDTLPLLYRVRTLMFRRMIFHGDDIEYNRFCDSFRTQKQCHYFACECGTRLESRFT